jgi:hypothetical protein
VEKEMLWCAGHASELAPEGSWLKTLLRESVLAVNSRSEHLAAASARLAANKDIGPFGCYVALHALRSPKPDSSVAFRDLGLKRLSTEDVRRDYRMLLDPGSVITRCLGNLARELGSLSTPQVEAIAEALPQEYGTLIRQMASACGKARDLPVAEAIGPVLDRWWETTARRAVEADFRFHTGTSSKAFSGPESRTSSH